MKRHIMFYLITLSLVLSINPIVRAFTFTTIDPPGSFSTGASGINSSGQIVGGFFDSKGHPHGFLASP
jgi:probable HAF family extracellular repeat protein